MRKTEGLVKYPNHTFETYKKSVMSPGYNTYQTAYDMSMAKMCAHIQYQHAFTHCKCVMSCCAQCPCIDIPSQK